MTEYYLSWDFYQKNICNGFSRLQQNQEFVDMTLAAGGHMVKVHQNIIALASPYLKGLIQSASCQHPVIFLAGISHEVLCFILEYVYAGEIRLPVEKMNSFLKAAKALCIVGVQDIGIITDAVNKKDSNRLHRESDPLEELDNMRCIDINEDKVNQICKRGGDQNISEKNNETHVNLYSPHIDITDNAQNMDKKLKANVPDAQPLEGNVTDVTNQMHAYSIQVNPNLGFISTSQNIPNVAYGENRQQYSITVNSNPEFVAENQSVVNSNNKEGDVDAERAKKITSFLGNLARYSLSNRGALQLIVNRYIYYCHHTADGGRRRRWRCIDYRRIRCKAYIDSEGDVFKERKFCHQHPFHDQQIVKKLSKCKVFDSIIEAQEKVDQVKGENTEDVIRGRDDDASDVDMKE